MASKKQIDVQSTLQQAARSRALIGLEDVFQYEDRSGNVVFNCTLCDVKLPPSELIRHVTGDMHKTIYLKTHKLEMYEEIYQQSRTETHYGKLLELAINKIMLKMGGFHKYSNIELPTTTLATPLHRNCTKTRRHYLFGEYSGSLDFLTKHIKEAVSLLSQSTLWAHLSSSLSLNEEQ